MIFLCWRKSAVLNMWAPEAIMEKLPSTSLHVVPEVSDLKSLGGARFS